MTADSTIADTKPKPTYARRRQSFGWHVAGTIAHLQHDYRKEQPAAIATLAQLRAAVTSPPGSAYAILEQTQVPAEHLGTTWGDDPTDTEHAKHTALTLWAVHQQSKRDRDMHVDGPGLGAAIGLLTRAAPSPEAVRRRFAALGTATTYDESLYHLRALIKQLRGHDIGLDYGLLADDLVTLRRPGGHDRVRGLWGRELYRGLSTGNDGPETTNSTGTTDSTKEKK